MILVIQIATVAVALVLITGILCHFVRGVLTDHAAQISALCDRVQAPSAAVAQVWEREMPSALPASDDELDEEWMRRPESRVAFDTDLALLGDDEREG